MFEGPHYTTLRHRFFHDPLRPDEHKVIFHNSHVVLASTTLAFTGAAQAAGATPLIEQTIKLNASDGARNDRFGAVVAISGTKVVVGAPWKDISSIGSQDGGAYLFDFSDPKNPREVDLVPSVYAPFSKFGSSVAISGSTAVVGAYAFPTDGLNSGAAILFDAESGQEIYRLVAPDPSPNAQFGGIVAISETLVLVSAPLDDEAGPDTGAVYVFDVATGKQRYKLMPDGGTPEELFGNSISVSGSTALIAAIGASDAGLRSGAAYVFDLNTGEQTRRITGADTEQGDQFGYSVSVSGTTACIGAPWDDDDGNRSGSAYLFDITSGQQIAKLSAIDAAEEDRFGISVSVSGTHAIIGAYLDDDGGESTGSAYIFDISDFSRIGQVKAVASDRDRREFFGFSVGMSDVTAIIGAPLDSVASPGGSAFIYDLRSTCDIADIAAPDSILDLADVTAFVSAFVDEDPLADLDGNLRFNFGDIQLFLGAFLAGCP